MVKYFFWTIFTLIILYCLYFFVMHQGNTAHLILNMWNKETLPRNFRSTSEHFHRQLNPAPSMKGFAELNASGSSQFSEKSLQAILNKIPNSNIIIVDLREESHGFMNGMAISWYAERNWANNDKGLTQIVADENNKLKELLHEKIAFMDLNKNIIIPVPIWVNNTATESQLSKSKGLGYLRIPVRDHLKPSDHEVDSFIRFVMSLPKDAWLHFHCSAGEGRTTTFLAMYDMMRNANDVTMEDIFKRQWLLGGINFLEVSAHETWKTPYTNERTQFLKQFCMYCKENPQFQQPWSSWKINKRLK